LDPEREIRGRGKRWSGGGDGFPSALLRNGEQYLEEKKGRESTQRTENVRIIILFFFIFHFQSSKLLVVCYL
jgi:hypothetical protein